MSKEITKLPEQVGQSITCDFHESTWTFEMPKGFCFTSGYFTIVPVEDFERIKSDSQLVSDLFDKKR